MNFFNFHNQKISALLLFVLCVNLFSFSFIQQVHAQGFSPTQGNVDLTVPTDENGKPYIQPNGDTGLTSIFGKQNSCALGGSQSELFNEILGPLAAASRASSILGKLTGNEAFQRLGYQVDGAGRIINSAGNVIGDIQSIANGDLSGILNAGGTLSEMGSLLDTVGLIDGGGIISSGISNLSNIFNGALSSIGNYVNSAISSVFGSAASSVAGAAAPAATAAAAPAAGGAAASVISVPVNDIAGTAAIIGTGAANVSAIGTAQSAITSLQQSDLEIQSALQFKEYVLDCTTWNASHRITEQVVADVLDFVTKGNTGISWITGQDENPYYLTNPVQFYNQLGNAVSNGYLDELSNELPNTPTKEALLALLEEDQKTSTVAQRLTPTIDQKFYTDFMGGGGWKSYLEVITNPVANDPFSGYMFAKQARDNRIASVANSYKTQLDYGQGFFPQTDTQGNVITPAPLIRESSVEAVNTGQRSLENAQNFWQLVGNVGHLVTDIFRGFSQRDSSGNYTGTRSAAGLSNVNTSLIVTPRATGTANPFAPGPTTTTTQARILEKLTSTQNVLTTARDASPVFTDSFNTLLGETTLLKDRTATGTLPTRTQVVSLQGNISSLITQIQTFSTATWYTTVLNSLTTARQYATDIIALTNV